MRRAALTFSAAILMLVFATPAVAGPRVNDVLPDLVQRAPRTVAIVSHDAQRLLVFGSWIDNRGSGRLLLQSARASRSDAQMQVTQRVWQRDGSVRSVPLPHAIVEFDDESTHGHWHLLQLDRFELRATNGHLIAADDKTGFCLGDRYAVPRLRQSPRHINGNCGMHRPSSLRMDMGLDPGWGDYYEPELDGQSIAVSTLPPGTYILVHRINRWLGVLDADPSNNVASARIEIIADAGGQPASVRLVRRCAAAATCPPA